MQLLRIFWNSTNLCIGTWFSADLAVSGLRLDSILKVFSNLNDSMILYLPALEWRFLDGKIDFNYATKLI